MMNYFLFLSFILSSSPPLPLLKRTKEATRTQYALSEANLINVPHIIEIPNNTSKRRCSQSQIHLFGCCKIENTANCNNQTMCNQTFESNLLFLSSLIVHLSTPGWKGARGPAEEPFPQERICNLLKNAPIRRVGRNLPQEGRSWETGRPHLLHKEDLWIYTGGNQIHRSLHRVGHHLQSITPFLSNPVLWAIPIDMVQGVHLYGRVRRSNLRQVEPMDRYTTWCVSSQILFRIESLTW